MKIQWMLLLTVCFCLPVAADTITYQGKLESGGDPFNGTAEMTFELHETDSGDTEIATHGPVNVEVSEGLFQEDLSFGAGAFDGDPRYLQIIIDGTPLAERHPIRPSPMALYAFDGDGEGGEAVWELNGSDIHYDDGHVGIGTASPGAPLQVDGSVITGSDENSAEGENSFVSGGGTSFANHVPGDYAFVAGGRQNEASGDQSMVSGFNNQATDFFSVVLGGYDNVGSGNSGFIGGGIDNEIHGEGGESAIIGGNENLTEERRSFIGGGRRNVASGLSSFIGAGRDNLAEGAFSVVMGLDNQALANSSFVGGGAQNTASGFESATVGGLDNVADGNGSFVGGGRDNVASGFGAFVAGGRDNLAEGSYSFAAGRHAHALHSGAFVWSDSSAFSGDFTSTADDQFLIRTDGGVGINTNSPQEALDVAGRVRVGEFAGASTEWVCRTPEGTLAECSESPGNGEGGSIWDQVDGDAVYEEGNVGIGTSSPGVSLEVVGSGHFGFEENEASGINSFVTGGSLVNEDEPWANIASGDRAFIGGGSDHEASGNGAAVVGGGRNTAAQNRAFIGGGWDNEVSASNSVVLGGEENVVTGSSSFIGGGRQNETSAPYATVVGGRLNTASGFSASIGGGTHNTAAGDRSFAVGYRAKAEHDGVFVWADNTNLEFSSTGQDQFLIRAGSGVGINTNDPSGFDLAVDGSAAKPGGGSWSTFSDARLKKHIQPLHKGGDSMLERLLELNAYSFEYIDEAVDSRLGLSGQQIGLLAQEVREVFPEWVDEDEEGYLHVTERGTTAIMIEALRELREGHERALAEVQAENDNLRQELAGLRDQVAANSRLAEKNAELEDRLAALEALLLEDRQVAEAQQ